MKDVFVYQPPGGSAQVALFIEGLDTKLRAKLLRQIIPLPRMPPSILREPHYKHFTYKVTYLGKPVTEEEQAGVADSMDDPAGVDRVHSAKAAAAEALPYITGGLAVLAIVVLAVLLLRSRREVRLLQEPEDEANQETEEHE